MSRGAHVFVSGCLACLLAACSPAQPLAPSVTRWSDPQDATPHRVAMPTREGVDVRLVHGQALCVNATNADIRDVLSRIAEVSGRPIVPARHVRGRVSIDLYGADFFETLEAVLAPLGLRYEEQGDSILVLSAWQVVKR